MFMEREYMVLDYSQRPSLATVFCEGFSFLWFTTFIDYGLDAPFGSGENEVIIFSGKGNYGNV